MRRNKKGVSTAGIWLAVMFGIFLLGTVYIVASDGFDKIHSAFYNKTPAEYQANYLKVKNIWKNYPIIGTIALIAAGIYATYNKSERDTGAV